MFLFYWELNFLLCRAARTSGRAGKGPGVYFTLANLKCRHPSVGKGVVTTRHWSEGRRGRLGLWLLVFPDRLRPLLQGLGRIAALGTFQSIMVL